MKSRLLIRSLLIVTVLLIILVISGYFWTKSYIRSDEFKKIVTHQLEKAVGGSVTVGQTEWDGWRLRNESIQVLSAEQFHDLEVNRLSLELDPRGFFDRVWRVSDLNIRELSVNFSPAPDSNQRVPFEPSALPVKMGVKDIGKAWLPRRAEVDYISIDNANGIFEAQNLSGQWQNVAVKLEREGKDYRFSVPRGMLSFDRYPDLEWQVSACQGRLKPSAVFFDSELTHDSAVLSVSGEKDFAGAATLQGNLRDLPVERLLPPDWQKRIGGLLQANFTAHLDANSKSSGSAHVRKANLTALPMLDIIADKTGIDKFRTIRFDTCEADFETLNDTLKAENIVLESESFLKITGAYTHSSQISQGRFEIGIAEAIMSQMPAGTGELFATAKDGYFWTTMNLSYQDGKWDEDLSPRLITVALRALMGGATEKATNILESLGPKDEAAGEKNAVDGLLKTGEGLIQKGAKSFFDLLGK